MRVDTERERAPRLLKVLAGLVKGLDQSSTVELTTDPAKAEDREVARLLILVVVPLLEQQLAVLRVRVLLVHVRLAQLAERQGARLRDLVAGALELALVDQVGCEQLLVVLGVGAIAAKQLGDRRRAVRQDQVGASTDLLHVELLKRLDDVGEQGLLSVRGRADVQNAHAVDRGNLDVAIALRLVFQHFLECGESLLLDLNVGGLVRRQAEAIESECAGAVVDAAAGSFATLALVEREVGKHRHLVFASDSGDAERQGGGLTNFLRGRCEARREHVLELELRVVLANLRHRDHAGRVDVLLIGGVDRLLQRRQDLTHDVLGGRTQRVARRALASTTEIEVITTRLRAALQHSVTEPDEGILVELPPEAPTSQVIADWRAATTGRRTTTTGRTGGAASAGTSRATRCRAGRRRSARASGATSGWARGTTSIAATAGARRYDVARATVLTTVGVCGFWQQGCEARNR